MCDHILLIAGDTTGLSQTALNQIATADQSAFTFTKVAKDFCSLGSDGKANVGTSATESAENEEKTVLSLMT